MANSNNVLHSDAPALNESQAQARESLVLLCRQMLSGELSFFEGAIQVCGLRFKIGVPEFDSDPLGHLEKPDMKPAKWAKQGA